MPPPLPVSTLTQPISAGRLPRSVSFSLVVRDEMVFVSSETSIRSHR